MRTIRPRTSPPARPMTPRNHSPRASISPGDRGRNGAVARSPIDWVNDVLRIGLAGRHSARTVVLQYLAIADPFPHSGPTGRVAERLKAPVLKTAWNCTS